MNDDIDVSAVDFEPMDLTAGCPTNDGWGDTLIRLRLAVALMAKSRAEMVKIAGDDNHEISLKLMEDLKSESDWLEGAAEMMKLVASRLAVALIIAAKDRGFKCST